MYHKDMKFTMNYIINLNIENICTQNGYKGGDILRVETTELKTIDLIEKWSQKMLIPYNIKHPKTIKNKIHKIFLSFGTDRYDISYLGDGTDVIYELKDT